MCQGDASAKRMSDLLQFSAKLIIIIKQPLAKRVVSDVWDHFNLALERKVLVLIFLFCHPVPLSFSLDMFEFKFLLN